MATEIIQVRDVPADDVAILRARAAARNMSLSSYLRDLIHDATSRPTMEEAIAWISTRENSEATGEDIREFIDNGRP